MARYIDADKIDYTIASVYQGQDKDGNDIYRRTAIATENEIDELPTADVVEVVRCKDCKHQPNLKTSTKGMMWCRKFRNEVTAIDYCSYGIRKENNEC